MVEYKDKLVQYVPIKYNGVLNSCEALKIYNTRVFLSTPFHALLPCLHLSRTRGIEQSPREPKQGPRRLPTNARESVSE